MRMYIHPGRGGRGGLLHQTPKYLSLKPPKLKFTNGYNDDNNQFNILRPQFENNKYQLSGRVDPMTWEERNPKHAKHEQQPEIPNSVARRAHVDTQTDAPETNHKNKTYMKTIRGKHKKKKFHTRSPKNYYSQMYMPDLTESFIEKSHIKVRRGKKPIESTRYLKMHERKDVEMEDANTIRNMEDLRLQYTTLCKELASTPQLALTASKKELEHEIDKLLDMKDGQNAEKTGIQENCSKANTQKKQKTVSIDAKAAFSPTFFREEDEYNDVSVITPEKIVKGSNKTFIDKIKEVALSANLHIPNEEYARMVHWNKEDLRKKLGTINVMKKKKLSDEKNLSTSSRNAGNHTLQSRAVVDRHSAKNTYDQSGLNAMKVSKTMVNASITMNKNSPPEVIKTLRKSNNTVNQLRHTYSARVRLFIGTNPINVGLVLKQMFDLWKEADPSIILLAHVNETDNTLMIDDTNKIPDEEQEIKKYVAGLYSYNQRLHFTLRFSGHQELSMMKKRVFSWMGRNRSFATIDKVKASTVHTVGFLHHVHPDFYNREVLKDKIKKHIGGLSNGDDINVFPRKMWIMNNDKKLQTRALVIEVPKESRDSINKHMMNFSLQEYQNLTYIPFSHVTDESYHKTMTEIFYQQNLYLHKTVKKSLFGIADATTKFQAKSGDVISFQDWVRSVTYEDRTFLEACEVSHNGSINLIYDAREEQIVQDLFGQDVKKAAGLFFNDTDMEQIFSIERTHIESSNRVGQEDLDYALFLKRKFEPNPQDSEELPSAKYGTKTYAEASKEPPLKKIINFTTPNLANQPRSSITHMNREEVIVKVTLL